jgi:phosphohistidine swiveling domain-containing protein
MAVSYNTLHRPHSRPSTWATTNISESIPGVPTPLGWSIWEPAGDLAVRRTFQEIGVVPDDEATFPSDPDERLHSIFFGRPALRVDLLCEWVERVPGTDSAKMAQAAFSAIPEGYVSRNQYRFFPRVMARATVPYFKAPQAIVTHSPAVRGARLQAIEQLPHVTARAARRWLAVGVWHWNEGLFNNTLVTLGAVQPAIDMLERLAGVAGCSGQELMAGYGGHQETVMVVDAWACSRDRLSFDEFIARHGYHGWQEGEISATVWREDPRPARDFIARYAARADSQDPLTAEAARVQRRLELERQFLAALPRSRRLEGKLALTLAAKYVPLRGAGKVTFLQGLDIARAAARRLGELLAERGELEAADDVFYLTYDELRGTTLPADRAAMIAERRQARMEYEQLEVPETFHGVPEPTEAGEHTASVIDGTAASPGTVEGLVRVVLDPMDAEIGEGEILVGHATDPSWASLMFLSSGLVADIGGTLSHTAVVARELGVPCVVNTKIATRALRTGDQIRLDGNAGRIEILSRAP